MIDKGLEKLKDGKNPLDVCCMLELLLNKLAPSCTGIASEKGRRLRPTHRGELLVVVVLQKRKG